MGLLSAMSASRQLTTGYKQALTQFNDLVGQAGVWGEYTADGVTTTIQYNIAEHGNLTGTTSPTDLAIQGNGFFLVKDPSGNIMMTRAGSFAVRRAIQHSQESLRTPSAMESMRRR